MFADELRPHTPGGSRCERSLLPRPCPAPLRLAPAAVIIVLEIMSVVRLLAAEPHAGAAQRVIAAASQRDPSCTAR
jgi:hypothetical protein